jgi:hypothetical protein
MLNFMQYNNLLKYYSTKPSLGKNNHKISSTSVSTTSNVVETMGEQEVIPPILVLDEGGERLSPSSTASSLSTAGGTASATANGVSSSSSSSYNRMPSLFLKPEEQYLDKYAACLAATEGLRKLRDSAVASSSSSTTTTTATPIHRANRKFLPNSGKDMDLQSELYRQACSEYALNSSKVIRALGLTVAQFNQIGRQVSSDPALKEKVR